MREIRLKVLLLEIVLIVCTCVISKGILYAQEPQKIVGEVSAELLSDRNNYREGTYKSWGGEYDPVKGSWCSVGRYTVGNSQYYVNIGDSRLIMAISEYDKSGKWIKYAGIFEDGGIFQKQPQTAYIAVTIKSTVWGVNLEDLFDQGMVVSLSTSLDNSSSTPKEPESVYQHNTIMHELTAYEFMEKMNVGWSLGDSFDSKSSKEKRGEDANLNQETNWGNPIVTKELIDYVKACGFNTIRIPVTWYYNTYTDNNGQLHIGKKWLSRIQQVVDYAIANDMYVIINSHNDTSILYAGTSDTEMEQVLQNAGDLWGEIAEYFKTYDEHLIFEAYNEIDNKEKSWNYSDKAAIQMNSLNQIFVSTVRATGGNNTKRILIIPTLLDSTKSNALAAFKIPDDSVDNRLIVEVHTYSKKFNQDIESDFSQLESYATKWGTPILIGEFGTNTSYPLPEFRIQHASNFVARAASHGMKCIWWDNGYDYAIINRRNFAKSDNAMIQALMSGTKGVAYKTLNETICNQPGQFVLKMPNLTTGAIESQYWGTVTTQINHGAVPIQQGTKCLVSLSVNNGASDIWLQRVLFYDKNGNMIEGKEVQKWDYICDIPDNAAFIRVSVNSPYTSISWEQYCNYMLSGNLEIRISSFDNNSLQPIVVAVQ